MKIAAVVCEYNPFHNGHKFHIEETRRRTDAEAVAAVMSGNFVQRGDVAVFDKVTRAEAAVAAGVDIVFELPAECSMQSAEFFAKSAVYMVNALGTVDFLSFGAETEDIGALATLGRFFAENPAELKTAIQSHYGGEKGLSFPKARTAAVGEVLGDEYARLIESPNNILAIEYIKALEELNSPIKPIAIMREGAAHDSESAGSGSIASASCIRRILTDGDAKEAEEFMPKISAEILAGKQKHSVRNMERALIADILKRPASEIRKVPDVTEGLENRIKEAAKTARTFDELCMMIKTKRYPLSRIRRIILASYLGFTDERRGEPPKYLRVLAHNETGKKVIAEAKKSSSIPIVRNNSQINKLKNKEIIAARDRENVYDALYELFAEEK